MYKDYRGQQEFVDFYLPFGGRMPQKNRWVKLSELMPWDIVTDEYKRNLANTGMGKPAIDARIALGAILIQIIMGLSDEDTVTYIQENPYAQYFLGYHEYQAEPLFDPSMMTHFRKRFNMEAVGKINEEIVKQAWTINESKEAEMESQNDEPKEHEEIEKPEDEKDAREEESNEGKLLVDATCVPADIAYPTDVGLLNKGREKTEKIIDELYEQVKGTMKKPRTYRKKARKQYLTFSKSRKPRKKKIRTAIRQQLGYIQRNQKHIEILAEKVGLEILTKKQYKELLVIEKLVRQQKEMYDSKTHKTADRIVSIEQPHVRPIKRGKASADTEFGAKISVAMKDGYSFLETLNWNNYGEGKELPKHIEEYKERTGVYPESAHIDMIYRTRENRKYCKERNIRISGPALGRPPKILNENTLEAKAHKKQIREDERARIPIEGKFGQCKRKYSMNRILTKLQTTSETTIALIILVVNLMKLLKVSFLSIFDTVLLQILRRKFFFFWNSMAI